jgi:FKBP-type peptidyl-prolyl cis-trans isomerase FklB
MNDFIKLLAITLGITFAAGIALAAPAAMADQEKRSYAIGANIGRNLAQQGVELDPALVAKGVADAMSGKAALTDDEINEIVTSVRDEARAKQAAERQKQAEVNRQRGAAFLAQYAMKDGVQAFPGGVLYRVLQAGDGDKPVVAEFVHTRYRGTLVDGTEFDATAPDARPAIFTLDKIIAGWREALVEMPVGSKWEIVIPAEKAYGENGKPPAIGPNETLVFEVELVGFE